MTEYTPKPVFVPVLAWIFIVLSSMAVAISALQNIMFWLVFPRDIVQKASHPPHGHPMPEIAEFAVTHIHWILAGVLLLSLLMLAASIGLLRRRSWARLLFMGLLGFGIRMEYRRLGGSAVHGSAHVHTAPYAPEFSRPV